MAAEGDLADQFEDLQLNTELPRTKLFRADQCVGTGVLRVDEHEVNWTGENGETVCLSYPEICLHAVSRDVSSFPHPCLYMLTSCQPDIEEEPEGEPEGEPVETVEMRMVLENDDKLEELFELISEGQALHPDPEDLSTDEEGEEGDAVILENFQPLEEGADFFRTEEDLQFLSPEGQKTLEHIESLLAASGNIPSGQNGEGNSQFEDAED